MGLLKKAENQTAAAKIGLYGEPGSGKTRTATEVAIGLAKLSKAPIAFFDSEGGADFMIPICERAGVELLIAKARAFADLMTFMKEAREAKAIIIVDSISHTWDDLRESYERKLKRERGLEIWDWGIIKPAWRKFTTEFLTSPCHAIVCGRAASIYEQVYNEARGKSEVQVVGTKMKTEKETAYEPSLLIEMERARRNGENGAHVIATIVKDRSDQLDGQSFPDPTFGTFMPFFRMLNIGGEHNPTDATRTSDHLFETPDNAIERKHQVEITLEKIKDAFILADIGSQSKEDKKRMKELLYHAFSTTAWSEVEGMKLEDLRAGLTHIRRALQQEDDLAPALEESVEREQEKRAPARKDLLREARENYVAAIKKHRPDLMDEPEYLSAWEAAVNDRPSSEDWTHTQYVKATRLLQAGGGPPPEVPEEVAG